MWRTWEASRRSAESSRYVQLSLYERQWFRLRYRAYGGNLRCLAGDLVEDWRLWKEVNSKAAKDIDGAVMLRFFLPPGTLLVWSRCWLRSLRSSPLSSLPWG